MGQQNNSLSEVHESVDTQQKKGFWKKLFSFLGPAYLVSVGYMDPGNWATDLAGGSKFGYSLLWVLLMSNLIALLLQSLSARLGIVSGRDLAQASRETYPKFVNYCLYFLAEIAIAACDLAEVLGMAIGLQLLFNIPLIAGVSITILDSFLLLFLINFGIRKMEAFIISLVAIIGFSFLAEMIFAQPNFADVIKGFKPTIPSEGALYIAIGIIGATVMPHNLYLHSSLVQTRKFSRIPAEIKKVIKYNFIDSLVALNLAFFVNASILILAASAFYYNGMFEIAEIQDAYKFLEPMVGNRYAPLLFAIALIAAGQSSTITGTLAGQIVMEGYINLRIQPWMRRLLTRLIAIIPAFLTIYFLGEGATGKLLVFSQVILSMQLAFAIIPLIHFVSDKIKMGEFAIGAKTKFFSWFAASIIVVLNLKLVFEELKGLSEIENLNFIWVVLAYSIAIACLGLLLFIVFDPILKRREIKSQKTPHLAIGKIEPAKKVEFKKIAITLDFSETDAKTLQYAISLAAATTQFYIIHISETAGALVMGNEIRDMESEEDAIFLNEYSKKLRDLGFEAFSVLGYGNPKKSIPELVNKIEPDILIMGAHGHKTLKDLILGTTVDAVRHNISVPLLVVKRKM
jgi:manganese transport protein